MNCIFDISKRRLTPGVFNLKQHLNSTETMVWKLTSRLTNNGELDLFDYDAFLVLSVNGVIDEIMLTKTMIDDNGDGEAETMELTWNVGEYATALKGYVKYQIVFRNENPGQLGVLGSDDVNANGVYDIDAEAAEGMARSYTNPDSGYIIKYDTLNFRWALYEDDGTTEADHQTVPAYNPYCGQWGTVIVGNSTAAAWYSDEAIMYISETISADQAVTANFPTILRQFWFSIRDIILRNGANVLEYDIVAGNWAGSEAPYSIDVTGLFAIPAGAKLAGVQLFEIQDDEGLKEIANTRFEVDSFGKATLYAPEKTAGRLVALVKGGNGYWTTGDISAGRYVYVAYGTSNAGAGFSLTPNNDLKYRAEFVSENFIAVPTLADFTAAGAVWVKYIGETYTAEEIIEQISSKVTQDAAEAKQMAAEAKAAVNVENIAFNHTDTLKGMLAINHGGSNRVAGIEFDPEPRDVTFYAGGMLLDYKDNEPGISGDVWFPGSLQSMLTPFKTACDDVTIEDKTYTACRVGFGEIGNIFTTENYNGETGNNPNDNAATGEIYGKLLTQEEAVTLDTALETAGSDYRVALIHDMYSMLITLTRGKSQNTTESTVKSLCATSSLWTNITDRTGTDMYEFAGLAYDGQELIIRVVDSNTNALRIKYASTFSVGIIAITDVGARNVRLVRRFGTVTIDGTEYKTVAMGNTWWTAENDRGTRYGKARPTEANTTIYGTAYKYQNAMDYDAWLKEEESKFRVPRIDEYQYALSTIGNLTHTQLKSSTLWTSGAGNNQSGFNALPAGYINSSESEMNIGDRIYFATTTATDETHNAIAIINTTSYTTSGNITTTFSSSIRLVQRFFDVPMPWGEVRRFVKIGHYFIDTRNLDWSGEDGTLGRFYQDNPALGAIHGLLYTGTEALAIQDYLRGLGIPLGVPTQDEWTAILSYSNGTHGTTLPADASAFCADAGDTYELGLSKDGWEYNGEFNYLDTSYYFQWSSTAGTGSNMYGLRISSSNMASNFNARNKDQFRFSVRLIFRAF